MKKGVFIFFPILVVAAVNAQSTRGITGMRDTSFTVYNEYKKLVKNYPDIKMVEELPAGTVAEERDIEYCKTGDRKLLLDAFYPKQKYKAKRTAILIIHGGGWRSGNKTLHHPLAQHLALLGYACFTPEYRLSTEALYPAAVYDLISAIRWIKQNAANYNIDTSRVVALGHSAGGELAAFIGSTTGNEQSGNSCHTGISGNVNAVIDIDGTLAFIHPESGEGDDSKRISAATYWFGYSKTENPELWKQASPLTYAGKNTAPTLFLNSVVERMHAGRDDYIKILDQYNIYSAVKTFEGAPHSFCLFDPWFEPMVKCIDEFLIKVFNSK
ncbi:MAG: alpha/beta hydrolase [Bacteroidota bacterium]